MHTSSEFIDMRKISYDILAERQRWSWRQKVDHSLGVIDQFCSRMDGKVFVSFSGGKDSTVMLDLCRMIMPGVKAVFFNTGMEFPDIIRFVRELKSEGYNIEIRNPKMKPDEVWKEYGFPLVSKEQAHKLWYMKNKPESKTAALGYCDVSIHNVSRIWRFLASENFSCNNKCCDVLKKQPSHEYIKETGLYPIIGTMATESLLRRDQYLIRGGCNSFEPKNSLSTPLSIWTDDDIWSYIRDRGLKISDIYGKGVKRTGCVCCGFGAHLEPGRFEPLYRLYPKLYAHIMGFTNEGVTFKEALRKVLAVKGITLPDERISADYV